jgi:GNAT superfamily N-acetyltransferase
MNYQLRKALPEDLPAVCLIFQRAVEAMNAQNISQWDEVYPNREVLLQDILQENMYVVTDEEGDICAVFTINREYDPVYANGGWHYKGPDFAILHRLCVDPARQNRGIGGQTLRLLEDLLRGRGYASLRLDAFSLNPFALRMYENAGYTKTGKVNFRKGLFFLYEKIL